MTSPSFALRALKVSERTAEAADLLSRSMMSGEVRAGAYRANSETAKASRSERLAEALAAIMSI